MANAKIVGAKKAEWVPYLTLELSKPEAYLLADILGGTNGSSGNLFDAVTSALGDEYESKPLRDTAWLHQSEAEKRYLNSVGEWR